MVSVTSASRYITSASRYNPRYQSRSSMYTRGLIPRSFEGLAEAVPIAWCRGLVCSMWLWDFLFIVTYPLWTYDFDWSNSQENICSNIKSKKLSKIRYRYNQVPHLTQDTTLEIDANTIKHHKREPRGQPFPSRWPQGSNEQTRKHDKHKTQVTQMIHKRSTALERSGKIFYWRA